MYAVNHLPMTDSSTSTTSCCSLIDPKEWDNQTFEFRDKKFAKVTTHSFLYFPLDMNSKMHRSQSLIEQVGGDENEPLMLSEDVSKWHSDHYIAVSKDIPGLEMSRLSGTFMTKVFEGPYKNAGRWYEQLCKYVKQLGKTPIKTYFYYTTCPKCAKVYKKNYVVGFAQVN